MKLSARNVLKGKVVAVIKGVTTYNVKIDIGHGVVITASIYSGGRERFETQKRRRSQRHYQGFGSYRREGVKRLAAGTNN